MRMFRDLDGNLNKETGHLEVETGNTEEDRPEVRTTVPATKSRREGLNRGRGDAETEWAIWKARKQRTPHRSSKRKKDLNVIV